MRDELTDEDMIEAAKAFGYDMRWARFCRKVKATRERLEKALSIMERVRKILHGTKWGKHGGAFDSGCPVCLINRSLETPTLPLPDSPHDAQLAALTLTWIAQRPREAGWYWFRHCDECPEPYVTQINSLDLKYPDMMPKGEWAGPLVLPQEPGTREAGR